MEWRYALPVVVVVVSAVVAIPLLMVQRTRKRARQAVERFRNRAGASLKLVTGCGLIRPPNRVPGVLALLDDRVLFEAVVALDDRGEVPLAQVEAVTWEDAPDSRHRMARKYRGARILSLVTSTGDEHVFAIAADTAPAWEAAMPAR